MGEHSICSPVLIGIPMPVPPVARQKQTRDERRAYERAHYAANVDKITVRKQAAYVQNQTKELTRGKRYREQNPEKMKNASQNWLKNNPKKRAQVIRDYIANREKIDPSFKLSRLLRGRLRKAIKRDFRSGGAVGQLGCTIDELKLYIEKLWSLGMDWSNWSFRGWHIDHVKPLSSFDLTDPDQLAKACHFTNLQPLWWNDNLKKGNNYADRDR